jgi:hypothetical protein
MEAELDTILFGGISRGVLAGPLDMGNSTARYCHLERLVRVHPCLAIEDTSVVEQLHGMLVLRLSELSRSSVKSDPSNILICLESLYSSPGVLQIFEREEKQVAVHVLLRSFERSVAGDADATFIRQHLTVVTKLMVSPEDWETLSLSDFRSFLLTTSQASRRVYVMDSLQGLLANTQSLRQTMVQIVLAALTAPAQTSGKAEETDYLTILDIEIRLSLGQQIPFEEHLVERMFSIACGEDMESDVSAAKILSMAAEIQPTCPKLLAHLFYLLLNGDDEIRECVVPGIFAGVSKCQSEASTVEFVARNVKSLIAVLLHVIQVKNHQEGDSVSIKATKILESIFTKACQSEEGVSRADLIAICTVLLDNPQVEVSISMCRFVLNSLTTDSSSSQLFDPNAFAILARFVVDRKHFDQVSEDILGLYFRVMETREGAVYELPRVPHFIESIVKISNSDLEDGLKSRCLGLLAKLADVPVNRIIVARQSGVVSSLIKFVRELDSSYAARDPTLPSRESVVECIQNLAAAL